METINKTIGAIGVLTLISGVWVYGQTPTLDKVPTEEYIKTSEGVDYYRVIKTTYDNVEQRIQQLQDEKTILLDDIQNIQNEIEKIDTEILELNNLL